MGWTNYSRCPLPLGPRLSINHLYREKITKMENSKERRRGAEKIRAKKRQALQADAAKCVKVKLKPKSNRGFNCDWIWVKPLCKSIITMKEALLRLTVVSFAGKLIFNGVLGHFYASINIAVFKTLRRLNTTWNFARSITRVSTLYTCPKTKLR